MKKCVQNTCLYNNQNMEQNTQSFYTKECYTLFVFAHLYCCKRSNRQQKSPIETRICLRTLEKNIYLKKGTLVRPKMKNHLKQTQGHDSSDLVPGLMDLLQALQPHISLPELGTLTRWKNGPRKRFAVKSGQMGIRGVKKV